jgi:hypothetical protein
MTLNGINNLDAMGILCNMASGDHLAKFTLRDLLYWLTLEDGSPLFIQLAQRPLGEVDVVIPNTPKAKTKAEKINHHVTSWCINYWKDTHPDGITFYRKLAPKAFSQILPHEVKECSWDPSTQTVTSPHAHSEMAAVLELKNQNWVKDIMQGPSSTAKEKAYVDPNVVFPFKDDFSVGTIHGTNATCHPDSAHASKPAPPTTDGTAGQNEVIEIVDDANDDNSSVLTSKTQDELVAPLVQTRKLNRTSVDTQVASCTDPTPVSIPAAIPSHSDVGGLESASINGNVCSRLNGK